MKVSFQNLPRCYRDLSPLGHDATHNPEFETCEFYRTYADLEELIKITEDMFHKMALTVNVIEFVDMKPPWRRLDFIPVLQAEMGCTLPSLDDPDLDPTSNLISMMKERSIKLPNHVTLPSLMDTLCAHYIEPKCDNPTWIIYPPDCLSPLSKSFTHNETGQTVAAKAELFVRRRELVNTYEEENSPIAQRKKFQRQSELNHSRKPDQEIDESYVEALEYGMPPTGGWGCGIERLTMLFSGANRISDTLAFGSIKNVLGLTLHTRSPIESEKENVESLEKTSSDDPMETERLTRLFSGADPVSDTLPFGSLKSAMEAGLHTKSSFKSKEENVEAPKKTSNNSEKSINVTEEKSIDSEGDLGSLKESLINSRDAELREGEIPKKM